VSKRIAALFVLLAFPAAVEAAEMDWPFCPLQPVRLPAITNDSWVSNELDTFVSAKLEAAGLQPAPEASRRVLIRRLYFDLLGLPPTVQDLNTFLQDNGPRAYENLVERLLQDPRYGERWARFWLDLTRYADTAGYEGDPDLPHAWRYRDYVIDAFNHDKPYDTFIKEQIAGDEFDEIMGATDLPETPPERVVALTFLRLAPFTEPRGDETRHELLSEMTSTVGSVFLGLTVGCAKCHDHKYDDIPTRDFYRMKAFFATVSLPRPEPGDIFQIGGPLPAEFYRPGETAWAENQRVRMKQEIDRTEQTLQELTTRLERQLAEDPEAKDKLRQIIDDSEDQRVSAAGREEYRSLSSRKSLFTQQLKRLRPVAMSLRHSYGPPYEPGVPTSRVMIRGEYNSPGESIEPGFLTCITGDEQPAPIRLDPFKRWPTRSRRMALAEWIARPENPLTARVMVNRLWHWHFGRGVVATPSDFGSLSGGASHPELLDWLAARFVDDRWSVKAIHRLIVTSQTYQQASVWQNDRAAEIDPDNRLLWRFRRRRLEAEAIRDSVLAISGRLNPEQFGLPIFPPLPGGIDERVKYTDSKWHTQHGPAGRKRSIYVYQQRTLSMPLMQAFDALVCDESRPLRRTSVTALQALALYNGDFVNEEAGHLSQRIRDEAGDDPHRQIQSVFLRVFGRPPSESESERMLDFMASQQSPELALTGLCRILYNTNEFVYVD
jgi:hypothetical protein